MHKRMRQLLLPAVAFIFTSSTAAIAEEALPVPDDEYVFCTVCHGVQLMGNAVLKAPRLSGFEPWYVEQQLELYKDGYRGTNEGDVMGYEMQPMAAALTDQQIREVAQFVSETHSPLPAYTIEGDAQRGEGLYRSCATCHAADGTGNEALGAPNLTIPDDWYLVTQLQNYQSGARGNNRGDANGRIMRAAMRPLTDDQAILDVVAYINTLRKSKGSSE